MAYVFRPRGVGELVDATFQVYRAHWWTMIKTVGALLLPVGVLQAGLQAYSRLVFQNLGASPNPLAMFRLMGFSLVMQVPAMIYALATMVVDAPLIEETGEACHGRRPNLGTAWRAVKERLGQVIGCGALTMVFIVLGTYCLCLIGGPIIAVFLTAVFPVVLLERANVGQALTRSFKLVRADFWRVLLTRLVILLIVAVPALLLFASLVAVAALSQRELSGVLSGFNLEEPLPIFLVYLGFIVYGAVMAPIQGIAKALIYFDLRVRQEGYDLERATMETGMTMGGNVGAPGS